MSPPPAFQPFGLAHCIVIALTIGLPIFFRATARGSEGYRVGIRYGLAVLLFANWVAYEFDRAAVGRFTMRDALPMQLCDWAMFASILALTTKRRGPYEVAYFWGLAGTLQAILTPNLSEGFPSLFFFNFFIAHAGIVVAVLTLTSVEGMRPYPGSILRAIGWSQVYLVSALIVNGLTGANYGFLARKPGAHTLLNVLSDNHGVYLLQIEMLAIAFYLVLYVPFLVADLVRNWLEPEPIL